MQQQEEEKLISMREAATYSFDIAYQVACALLEGHENCPGCIICDVINAAISDVKIKQSVKGD